MSECVCVDVMMEVACLPVAARSPPRMGGLDGSSKVKLEPVRCANAANRTAGMVPRSALPTLNSRPRQRPLGRTRGARLVGPQPTGGSVQVPSIAHLRPVRLLPTCRRACQP